jgi:hypothetical protein
VQQTRDAVERRDRGFVAEGHGILVHRSVSQES